MRSLHLLTVLVLAVTVPAASAFAGTCKTCRIGGNKAAACCSRCANCDDAPTQWADPASVHWAHKGVSFGNYLKFAKAEFPAAPVEGPRELSVYFDFDKSALRPEAVETCRHAVEFLRQHPEARVSVIGNCCDIGTEEYNMALGQRRADAVKRFLVESGIDAGRITTISRGEGQPRYPRSQRELNRRGDIDFAGVQIRID
ncbi:MAG: hypothetical protein AMXMBFR4_03840 [Candidatus Hydrogenedentota bacterium]